MPRKNYKSRHTYAIFEHECEWTRKMMRKSPPLEEKGKARKTKRSRISLSRI